MPTEFEQQVYDLCSQIPREWISTYSAIADCMKTSPRAVALALSRNPYPISIVPCYRVVTIDGRLTGYGGKTTKEAVLERAQLLAQEGVQVQYNQRSQLAVCPSVMHARLFTACKSSSILQS